MVEYRLQGSPSSRLSALIACSLVLGAFGPYVPLIDLRVDQIAIYLLSIPATLYLLSGRTLHVGPGILLAFVAVLALTAAAALSTVLWIDGQGVMSRSVLAGLENYVKILAIILVAVVILMKQRVNAGYVFSRLTFLVITLTVANIGVAAASQYFDLWPLIQWFKPEEGGQTWLRSFNFGRYIGLLDAPSQAGILYAITAVMAFMLYRLNGLGRGLLGTILALLLCGAWLARSKACIVLLVAGAAIYLIHTQLRYAGRPDSKLFGVLLVAACSSGVGLLVVSAVLIRRDLIAESMAMFSGNRLALDGSPVANVVHSVVQQHPMLGLGFSVDRPIDGGFLLFFYNAGVVGLGLGVVFVLALTYSIVKGARRLGVESAGYALAAMVIVAEMATPTLTRPVLGTTLLLLSVILSSVVRSDRVGP